jgi:hypothetical protein
MKHFLFLVFGIVFVQMAQSQEVLLNDTITPQTDTLEIFKNINVSQDSVLIKLVNWHVEDNQRRNGIEGYRVEIFSNRDMEKIQNTKIEFMSKYPEQPVHIKFIAPIFKIRIGDFRSKSEALQFFKGIEEDYRSAFIVRDIINFPLAKTPNYE